MRQFQAIILLLLATTLYAENVNINQIDTSRLLINQEVDLYFSVTDDQSKPIRDLTIDQVTIAESYNGGEFFTPASPRQLTNMSDLSRGIHFYFLMDNSGSMYEGEGELPAEQAQNALLRFAGSISNPKDTLGLASFNTNFISHLPPGSKDRTIGRFLSDIEQPQGADAYTELFWAIHLAAQEMAEIYGRKALVVLSDGENFSYTEKTGKEHPVFGSILGNPNTSLESLRREGISLFAINFGGKGDPQLGELAIRSGGTSYKAYDQEELLAVYSDIKERILTEYVATYRAKQPRNDKQWVRLMIDYGGDPARGEQYFYSENLMGEATFLNPLPYLFLFPLAGLLLSLIGLIHWEKPARYAMLDVVGAGRTKASAATIALTQSRTVIGSSTEANLTLTGSPSVEEQHVTVDFNDKTGEYTLATKSEVMVNNNPVKKRVLNSGDVINIEGTTIVFDEPKK